MSVHSYARAFVSNSWDVNLRSLSQAVQSALPGKAFTADANDAALAFMFVDVLDAAEIAVLDTAVAVHKAAHSPLDVAKKAKIVEIDARTTELIDNGFEYPPSSGVFFSLSTPGQTSLLGLEVARDDAAFLFPVNWNSKDDTGKNLLADSPTAHGFFLTALGTVRAHLDGGTAVKDMVRAATTLAEVDAIVDPR